MVKRAVILALDDLRHITMTKIYTDYFKQNNIPFDYLCTSRYGEHIDSHEGVKVYSIKNASFSDSKIKKVVSYLRFRKYAIHMIDTHDYDFIVVWGENTAVLFSDYLEHKYHSRYSINIRDIAFRDKGLYWNRLKTAVENSLLSTWCAQNGIDSLPRHDYLIVLNQNKELVSKAMKKRGLLKRGSPIHLGVVGYIRHIEPSKDLMRAFCNDDRYILQFFGTGASALREFAKTIDMTNVEIEETFRPEDTYKYLDRIDVINAYCGDGKEDSRITYGAPIRFGYATLLYKPAIVSPNTYISSRTKELNIAYTISNITQSPNKLYQWYHSLDYSEFCEKCDRYNQEYDDSLIDFWGICDERIKPILQ